MIWTLLGLVVLMGLGGCAIANRFYTPPRLEAATFTGTPTKGAANLPALTVTTWNVGYAGMGAESDFILDKGKQRRPLSGGLVDRNLAEIRKTLGALDSDVILLQEAARPSWLTYRRDVLDGLIGALPGYAWTFGPDLDTRYVPPPFNLKLGNAIFTRIPPESAERRALPLEPTFELGLFRKGYRMHIMRLGAAQDWVIVNIHLSTFDTAEDDVRRQQVTALMAFAKREYAAGRHVVIGGDWNLELADTDFPHTTPAEFQFWVRDFPPALRPDGWQWAVDPTIPTVRLAHQPHIPGENMAIVIDGFLVSPNVAINSVRGQDLGFRHTDHHPVTARFAARD